MYQISLTSRCETHSCPVGGGNAPTAINQEKRRGRGDSSESFL